MKKTKKDIEIEAVKAIVSGELFLEEAMHKYYVKDRRTMVKWLKKWAIKTYDLINTNEEHEN